MQVPEPCIHVHLLRASGSADSCSKVLSHVQFSGHQSFTSGEGTHCILPEASLSSASSFSRFEAILEQEGFDWKRFKNFLKKKKLKSWCRYSSVCPPCNRSSVLELLTHPWVFTKPCARGHSKSQLPEAEKVLWLASLSLLLNESLPAGVASPSERAGLLGTNEA